MCSLFSILLDPINRRILRISCLSPRVGTKQRQIRALDWQDSRLQKHFLRRDLSRDKACMTRTLLAARAELPRHQRVNVALGCKQRIAQ